MATHNKISKAAAAAGLKRTDNQMFDPIRNGPVYSAQYEFRQKHGGTIAEARQAWFKETGMPWLTPRQITGVEYRIPDEGLDFPLRIQAARTLSNALPPSGTRFPNPEPIVVRHEHFDMQKSIETRVTGSLAEKNTIDELFKTMGGEIKPNPESGDFDQAVGKLARVRASNAAKELSFITDAKPKLNGVALQALALLQATWIFQMPTSMAIYNEQFAGPDTKEFVERYNAA